ncbi:MAG: hypothetical protein ABIA66_01325 [Candidatus Omnitrophota bacterium]
MKSFVLFSRAGCLLPFFIIFNLFFGLFFFSPLIWLSIQVILILIFLINGYIITRKVTSFTSCSGSDNVIDVKAEVMEEAKENNKQLE